MTPPDPPADPLASPPRWCPECGYVMAGLPAVGRCPECGWGYDESTVVLYGRAVESVEGARPESRFEPVVATVLIAVLTFVGVFMAVDNLVITVIASVGVAGGAFAVAWRRRLTPSAPREQVRLTPDGYARRRGFGPVQVEPWTADVELTFRFDSAAPDPPDSPGRPGRSADLSGGPAVLVIRRGGRGYRFAATSSVRAMVRFDAAWEDVDRLARRTAAWRDGA